LMQEKNELRKEKASFCNLSILYYLLCSGFRLPASHVHTVGPIYNSNSNSAASLSSAYRNSLRVAKDKNIQYIALPAISCGVFGEFRNEFKEIHFVLFLQDIYQVWVNKENDLMKN
ncbi:hypothetical protein HN51_036633, partial [Arachis hypogaea]